MGNSCVTSQDIDRSKVKPASNNAATLKPPVSSAISRQSSKVHPSKSSPPEYESSHWNQQEVLSMSNNSDKSTRFSSFTSRRSMIFFRRASNVKKCETLVIANNHSSVLMKIDQQILQKYLIHNEIGKGASSTIVLIEDKLTSVQYALKISEKKKAYSNSIPWEREIEILRRVRHPNIVYLLEAHATSNKVYSVLELAFGGDLAQRLDRVGYFTEAKTISLMSSIIDAVRYLHKHGVTHRDIKMENCLFKTGDDDSKIMLSDFGLAHLNLDTNTTDGMQTTCGTVDYVAPEIVEGYVYTQAVDLWACGVITYALLSGTLPFTDTSKGRMFKRIREGAYQFDNEIWKDVSDSAKDFISHLICVDTTKRFSAEKALQHGWIALTTNSN